MEFHGSWPEALESTTAKWRRIRDAIQVSAPVDLGDLMAEVSSVCALCDRAREEAHRQDGWRPCPYCPAFQQLGGCLDLPGKLNEALAAKDREAALALAQRVLADLATLELPQGT